MERIELEIGKTININNFRVDQNKRAFYKKSTKSFDVILIKYNRIIPWRKNQPIHKDDDGNKYEVFEWIVREKVTRRKGYSIFMIPLLDEERYASIYEEFYIDKKLIPDYFDYHSMEKEQQYRKTHNLDHRAVHSMSIVSNSLKAYESYQNKKIELLEGILNKLNNSPPEYKKSYKILYNCLTKRLAYLKSPTAKTLREWRTLKEDSSHQKVLSNLKLYLRMKL